MDDSSNPTIVLSSTQVTHVEHEEFLPLAPLTSSTSSLSPGYQAKSDTRPAHKTTDEGRSRTTIPTHHFTNTTSPGENKPGYGTTSLALLGPDGPNCSHSRGQSSATMILTEEGTIDNGSSGIPRLHPAPSNIDTGNLEIRTNACEKARNRVRSYAKGILHEGDGDEEMDPELDPAQDTNLNPAPFKFRPHHLASLVDPKNLDALEAFGGIIGLLAGLGVNPRCGLPIGGNVSRPEHLPTVTVSGFSGGKLQGLEQYSYEGPPFTSTIEDRQQVYGVNVLPVQGSRSLLQLIWLALKDRVLILLSIAAVISLALGLFQDFGPGRAPGKPPVDWVEGVAIIGAIFVVVMVGSLNDWQKERQFRILNDKKKERGVKVVRCGDERVIDVKDLLVGDIALLEPGEIIPCDGVFISGHNVRCDESGATGESDAIKKVSYDDCIALRETAKYATANGQGSDTTHTHADCFMVSGSKIREGHGKYVVIAVGRKSFNGRTMMALWGSPEPTPLQKKLNKLAELIARIGGGAGFALFIALTIRLFAQFGTEEPARTADEKGIAFTQILIISVTLVVVAVPEGLPLAVSLALAFATRRMTTEKILVRILGSCEIMVNASVVCTDKTGTLTQNVMTVVAGSIGVHGKFARNLKDSKNRTNAPNQAQDCDLPPEQDITEVADEPHIDCKDADDFSIDQSQISSILSPQLRRLFNQSIAINSTAFEGVDPEAEEVVFVGSKTETALLQFAKDLGWDNWRHTRDSAEIFQMIPFSSERKAMGVVIRLRPGRYRLFLKGASEILTKKCTRHVVVSKNADQTPDPHSEIGTKAIDETTKDNISRTISFYANQMLRTIALCYRDFSSWPPPGAQLQSADEVGYDDLLDDVILVAIIGIGDPLRPGVRDAVASCRRAGVTVKMCTGDNVHTARSIATQCGIYTAGGIIMEGSAFRALDPKDRTEVVPRLQVLARSSPEDKKLLVETLRSLGEIVGVTGDGTNDGPALKTANVGFSMGIAGTEVAKEASDVILMDDNFSSIVKAIMWGRCVNDAVPKFLQFQISTNITTVIITFVSAVASGEEGSVLTAVQLLWINIIMDTFAALALATDPASKSLLDRKPDTRGTRLFTADMIKMILGQSIYQVAIIFTLHFLGHAILGLDHSDEGDKIVATLVFNTFVFAQIFNSVNCRRLDNKLNVFEGILNNWYFIVVTFVEIFGQILIVFVGGTAFQVMPIPAREWGISLALGFASIPLGALIRYIPTPPLERAFIRLRLMSPEVILPITGPKALEFPALVASSVGAGSAPLSETRSS
ncbi:Ca-transporting ATPase [Thelephora terrestris]|uniref:Calcium-transporting ATPase n=1 Tax=Thelephora terrestris TaxID=56493 RepID=A0A9P6H4H2_9AGAM|nr:Ca-transporting ATPase [Thelephora terrestris]